MRMQSYNTIELVSQKIDDEFPIRYTNKKRPRKNKEDNKSGGVQGSKKSKYRIDPGKLRENTK